MMDYSEKTVPAMHMGKPPILVGYWMNEMHTIFLQGHQILGRPVSGSRVGIEIPMKTVSRNHGDFFTTQEGCMYRDMKSTNGTWLNHRLLRPGEVVRLKQGDILRIRNQKQPEMEVLMVFLTDYVEDTCWNVLQLDDSIREIQVGRTRGELYQSGPELSAKHASFFLAHRGWALIDHNSTNGVFLNGIRVDKPKYLRPFDVVWMGGYTFLYMGNRLFYQADLQQREYRNPGWNAPDPYLQRGYAPDPYQGAKNEGAYRNAPQRMEPVQRQDPSAYRDRLSISIIERSVWSRMRKQTLLKDIHMEIPGGSMVLILGGSGAGKTTFMNAVMGYEPAKGNIRYRGTDIYDEYEKMKYEIGYVPQQDLLRMGDRVWDTLYNAAEMRLSTDLSKYEIEDRVRKTLTLLGLERERDSFVSKLSGGQRKRLSIAVEYVGNPSLFFLDEPDSGLDGTMSRALMENLRQIADMGKIILLISHSPDRAFELFDKIIVLAKGDDNCGHLVFFGSPQEGCRFFGVDSLEKIVGKINRPDEGGEGRAEEFIRKYAALGGGR